MFSHRSEMEIHYRRRRLTADEKARIVRAYNAGQPIAVVLTTFGIGRSTLYAILRAAAQRPRR